MNATKFLTQTNLIFGKETEKQIEEEERIISGLLKFLKKSLLEIGINEQVAIKICRSFEEFSWSNDVEDGIFVFSSKEREEAVMSLWKRYNKKYNELR